MSHEQITYVPLMLSVTALIIWVFSLSTIADYWRHHHSLPSGVMAALLMVVVGSVIGRLVIAPYFVDRTWDVVFWAHIERGLLITMGLYTAALLVHARRRW